MVNPCAAATAAMELTPLLPDVATRRRHGAAGRLWITEGT
jgi:hypothetical protein